MSTITLRQVNEAKRGLENITHEAKRRLFEFETISNLYEIERGKVSKYKTARSFIRSLRKQMRSLVVSKSAQKKIKLFNKKYPELKTKLESAISGLLKNQFPKSLGVHKLTGRLKNFYAANINYEYRLVFLFDNKYAYLINIGSHDEVY